MASYTRGTLYIGVTSEPEKRIAEHKYGTRQGFTSKHDVRRLVYFEEAPTMQEAIAREKQLKNWHRGWKINLIETQNPQWKDLSAYLFVEVAGCGLDPETSSG